MLQWIRRQHPPYFRKPWRNLVAQPGHLRFIQQHDRCGGGREQRHRRFIEPRRCRQHHRQRFRRAMLARPQPRDGLRISGIAQQMETTQPFHRHYIALHQASRRRFKSRLAK